MHKETARAQPTGPASQPRDDLVKRESGKAKEETWGGFHRAERMKTPRVPHPPTGEARHDRFSSPRARERYGLGARYAGSRPGCSKVGLFLVRRSNNSVRE